MLFKAVKRFLSELRPPFLYAILLLPLFFALGFLMIQNRTLSEWEDKFIEACAKGKVALERKGRKEKFLQKHTNADAYFLAKKIETLLFLQNEKRELETLLKHPALTDKRLVEERLRFLASDTNRIVFDETGIRTTSKMKETEEKQRQSVQMDETDLKKLLSLIEGVQIDSFMPLDHSPQNTITEFWLKSKNTSLHTHVMEVEMNLITREFFQ